jgi:16S rRNA G527 N7-methylase RsmG
MHTSRIAELLAPFLGSSHDQKSNTEELFHAISTYIDILVRWNARINLTAIRDPQEIVTRHFGESLFAARHLFPSTARVAADAPSAPSVPGSAVRSPKSSASPTAAHRQNPHHRAKDSALAMPMQQPQNAHGNAKDSYEGMASAVPTGPHKETGALAPEDATLADLGSGAGFPGLPIKLWAPHIALTLIESNHKKATFLREVTRALTLTDVNIQNVRAEDLRQTFDVVTLRAVERFDKILPEAARLLNPAGRLALLVSSAQPAIRVLPANFQWSGPIPIPLSRSRILLIGRHLIS